jgi:hypothetical protein
MKLLLTLLLQLIMTFQVFGQDVSNHHYQKTEMRRQYQDYLTIFNKQERPNSYAMFLENLSRISNRECDRHVDRYTDEELTFLSCDDKTVRY